MWLTWCREFLLRFECPFQVVQPQRETLLFRSLALADKQSQGGRARSSDKKDCSGLLCHRREDLPPVGLSEHGQGRDMGTLQEEAPSDPSQEQLLSSWVRRAVRTDTAELWAGNRLHFKPAPLASSSLSSHISALATPPVQANPASSGFA